MSDALEKVGCCHLEADDGVADDNDAHAVSCHVNQLVIGSEGSCTEFWNEFSHQKSTCRDGCSAVNGIT